RRQRDDASHERAHHHTAQYAPAPHRTPPLAPSPHLTPRCLSHRCAEHAMPGCPPRIYILFALRCLLWVGTSSPGMCTASSSALPLHGSMTKCASVVRPVRPLIGRMSCGQAENAMTRSMS